MGNELCTVCNSEPAVILRQYQSLCRFCWDSLQHELKLRLDAIKHFGPQHRDNSGPRFLAIFFNGEKTLGYGLYVPRTPQEALSEAFRTAQRNNWLLLRVDIQKTLADIYVSEDYQRYFPGSTKGIARG